MTSVTARKIGWLAAKFHGMPWADVGTTAGADIVNLASALLASVMVARLLGPQMRGEIAAVIAWGALCAALGSLGIPQAVTYFAAKREDDTGGLLGTFLFLAVMTGFALTIFGMLLLVPMLRTKGTEVGPATAIYLVSIAFSLIGTDFAAAFQGINRLKAFNGIRMAQSAAYFIAVFSATLATVRSVRYIVLFTAALQALAAVGSIYWASRLVPLRLWHVDTSIAKNLFRYGVKTYAGNLSWLVNGKLDQMVLSLFVPMYSLGIYAVSVSYSSLLFAIGGAFAVVAFPRVASAASCETGLKILHMMLRANLTITVPLALIMMTAAPRLLPIVFGRSFKESAMPALVLLVGGVLLGCNYVLHNGLRALGFPLRSSVAELLGVVVTVVGLLLCVPRWGIMGAAWVSVLSYGTTSVVLIRSVAAVRQIPDTNV